MFHKKLLPGTECRAKVFFIALDSLGGCQCVSTVGQFFANGTVFVRGGSVRHHVASPRSQIFRTNPVIHQLTKHTASNNSTFGSSENAGKTTWRTWPAPPQRLLKR